MSNGNVKINICKRCNHEWVQRKEDPPVSCPKCHSPYWQKPRKKQG